MMSFESVVCALQEMGISLEEFDHFLNDYFLSQKEIALFSIENASFQTDEIQLVIRQSRIEQLGCHHLFSDKDISSDSPFSDIAETFTSILYEIDLWGFSELYLLYLTMDYLSPKDILYLFKKFFLENHPLFRSEKLKPVFVQASLRAVSALSKKGYKNEAHYILEQVEQYALISTMFHQNLRNMTKGFWIYCFVNKTKGEKIMRQGLDILESLSGVEVFNYYKNRYKSLTNK